MNGRAGSSNTLRFLCKKDRRCPAHHPALSAINRGGPAARRYVRNQRNLEMNERKPAPIWGGWWFWEPPIGKTKENEKMIDIQQDDIGRKVLYRSHHGTIEEGVITSYNSVYVFVRFGADVNSKACDLKYLEIYHDRSTLR